MIDLEEVLNCKDCRIKDTCRIFTVVKELYCISDLENCVPECEKKEKLVFKICRVCGKNMSKGLDGAGTITHECVYCGHKFTEEKQVTISKEEHVKLLKSAEILSALEYFDVKHWKYYKDAMDMLNDWNNKE